MDALTCDSCGQQIENINDGWVEWISFSKKDQIGKGLRIVHKSGTFQHKCNYNQDVVYRETGGILSDASLVEFIGPDGLMRLLAMISESKLPTEEVLEVIKRLNIPGYDKARSHFEDAIQAGIFQPSMAKNFYCQSNINETIKFIGSKTKG